MDEMELLYTGISYSLQMLYDNDFKLICDEKNNHVSERSIVFKFGKYFDEYCKEHFKSYIVDIEYNRNIYDIKRIGIDNVIPDLILHQRQDNKHNLLVLEFKTWWNVTNENLEADKLKVSKFMNQDGDYCYKYGMVIVIGKSIDECKKYYVE